MDGDYMDNFDVLISESKIKRRINVLANRINKDYGNEDALIMYENEF